MTIVREIIEGGDSVSGIVINPEYQQVYLVEQYRATVNDWPTEAVAGMIDEDEGIAAAFCREVQEELGVELSFTYQLPAPTHGSIGTKTGKSYHFFAITKDVPNDFTGEDQQEDIKVKTYDLTTFNVLVRNGRFIDPKILIPYLFVKAYHPQLLEQ